MKIFLAGIMQGSHASTDLHDQDYRNVLGSLLQQHVPGAEIYDPLADHGDSVNYDDALGREVFARHNAMCGQVDVVIAFLPEASMGTAIEMYEAHQNGRVVISISPMGRNWSVKFLSDRVYPDMAAFTAAVESGEVAEIVQAKLSQD